MYLPPRPLPDEDPWFAVRLATVPAIGMILGLALHSPLAPLYPALMFGLMANSRKAFDPIKTIAAPVVFSAAIWFMSFVVMALQGIPAMLIIVLGLFFFLACFLVQQSGSPVGMLIIASAVLMSVMGVSSYATMDYLRVEMTKASFATLFIAPFLYWLLPPRTNERAVDIYVPADENGRLVKSAIRALVLLALTAYLLMVLDSSNMMLAIGAMFVVVFPTRETLWRQASERSFSTLLGGAAALGVLWLMTISAHLVVLMTLSYLASLWFCQRMMTGRLPPSFYQNGVSVMISIVGSGLISSEPFFVFVQRVVLTAAGAIVAAFAVSLLEALLVRPAREVPA